MSVPFVTLAGSTPISRAGECILWNVALNELIAPTKPRYIELCIELSNDLPRLAQLRRELRDRMMNSPLAYASTFTGHLESAYRAMWRDFTASG